MKTFEELFWKNAFRIHFLFEMVDIAKFHTCSLCLDKSLSASWSMLSVGHSCGCVTLHIARSSCEMM